MEARYRSSSAAVLLPLTFALQRSNSPTGHFNSPSSSSPSNFAVHRTLSPTLASFSGANSYSSASAATSSSINFGLERSASQVRSARCPISPKGDASMKPIPCAPPRKTCMCSPSNHPAHCEKVCHDEFAGEDRWCGRRIGKKSPHGSHTPLQAPYAKENFVSAAAQQALPYDQGPRCLLKFASGFGSSPFSHSVLAVSPIVSLTAEQHAVFFLDEDFAIDLVIYGQKAFPKER